MKKEIYSKLKVAFGFLVLLDLIILNLFAQDVSNKIVSQQKVIKLDYMSSQRIKKQVEIQTDRKKTKRRLKQLAIAAVIAAGGIYLAKTFWRDKKPKGSEDGKKVKAADKNEITALDYKAKQAYVNKLTKTNFSKVCDKIKLGVAFACVSEFISWVRKRPLAGMINLVDSKLAVLYSNQEITRSYVNQIDKHIKVLKTCLSSFSLENDNAVDARFYKTYLSGMHRSLTMILEAFCATIIVNSDDKILIGWISNNENGLWQAHDKFSTSLENDINNFDNSSVKISEQTNKDFDLLVETISQVFDTYETSLDIKS